MVYDLDEFTLDINLKPFTVWIETALTTGCLPPALTELEVVHLDDGPHESAIIDTNELTSRASVSRRAHARRRLRKVELRAPTTLKRRSASRAHEAVGRLHACASWELDRAAASNLTSRRSSLKGEIWRNRSMTSGSFSMM